MAQHRPTIIDSVRGVKNDFKKLGVNLVSTVKSARHSAGHLGFRDNVKLFRKNVGRDEMGAIERIRDRISTQESSIPRPEIFIDDEGNMKFPILNKIKDITGKEDDESVEGDPENSSSDDNLGLQGPEEQSQTQSQEPSQTGATLSGSA